MLKEEARTSLKIALVFAVFRLYTKDAISGHLTKTAVLLTSRRYYITHCIIFLSTYTFLQLILIFIMRLVLPFGRATGRCTEYSDFVSVDVSVADVVCRTLILHYIYM